MPHALPPAQARQTVDGTAHRLRAARADDVGVAEHDGCAPETIAWKPLPQSRFTVSAGTSSGSPAKTATTRAAYISLGSV